MRSPPGSIIGVSHPRASGPLVKWVQDSASKASFLQLLTALPISGLRQLSPLLFTLNAWAAQLGNTWRPEWCSGQPAALAFKSDLIQVGRLTALGTLHTHSHTQRHRNKRTHGEPSEKAGFLATLQPSFMSYLKLKQRLISCQLLPGDGEKGMAGLSLLELRAQLPHHWPISQPGRQRSKFQICPGSRRVLATVASRLQRQNSINKPY